MAPAVPLHTVESVPILAGRISSDAVAAGVSAPMIDTARQSRTALPIEPDDASYALVRWYLDRRLLPPPEAIRIASLANAFAHALPSPQVGALGLSAEVFPSPARPGYHILHLGLRGTAAGRRGTTFVVVVESSAASIPRIREAVREFAGALGDRDLLGLVARGAQGRMILEPTERDVIDRAVDALTGDGAPDLIAGLQAGYDMATRQAGGRPGRILLFSDGDGVRPPGEELFDDLERQARAGLTLSVVGFPVAGRRREGYDDRLMARLARAGEGRYAIADNAAAARGLLPWLPDSLVVVARDVTGRIELDPETVSRFRLLGDPPSRRAAEGGGDGRSLAAGGRATALIELQLTGRPGPLGAVRVRYRAAESDTVKQFEMTLTEPLPGPGPPGLRSWIAAAFGEKLGGSYWARDVSYGRLLRVFRSLDAELRTDPRTAELHYLIQQARRLEPRRARSSHPDAETGPDFAGLRVIE